jgi:hypothetical protein
VIRVAKLFAKISGAVGIAVVLCWVMPAARQVDARQGFQKTTPSPCLDASLSDLAAVQPETVGSIASLSQGIKGLPCDAKGETNPPKGEKPESVFQNGFDYYSWLTFIALNSPADGAPIGKDAVAVWQTWKQLPDVMLDGGEKPKPWNDPPSACRALSKPGVMTIHMEMEETYNEPFKSGPLFDQNGNYALFVIFMNQAMFDYIVDDKRRLYSVKGQRDFNDDIDFPSGSLKAGEESTGSVMVKASWKILIPGVDDESRYHVVDALLNRPNAHDPCRQVRLGLIGFHVGHKTSTRQQWIWTTFEHHDNVPTQREVAAGIQPERKFSFYCGKPECAGIPANQTPPGPWDPDKLTPPWEPGIHPNGFKSQIVRTGLLGHAFDDVEVLNKAFHAFLKGSVWENYDLVTTQWPSDFGCSTNKKPGTLPDATCSPFPSYLANSTLETFSQPPDDDGVPLATSSCISCHNNATTHHSPATRSDFTYILEKAKGAP